MKCKMVIEKFTEDNVQCIQNVLKRIEFESIINELTLVLTHLSLLVKVIKNLKTQNITLYYSFSE